MTLKQRIKGFVELGLFINRHFTEQPKASESGIHEGLEQVIETAHIYNNWFIPNFVKDAIVNIGSFLKEEELEIGRAHV